MIISKCWLREEKKTIINFIIIYCYFIWRNLNPPHPWMLCAKIGWNWLCGSGEENFLISSMYFRYFIIISLCKRAGPFIEQTWIPFTQGYFLPSLVEIGPVVLEKKMKIYRQTDGRTNRRRMTGDQKSSLELLSQVSLKTINRLIDHNCQGSVEKFIHRQ